MKNIRIHLNFQGSDSSLTKDVFFVCDLKLCFFVIFLKHKNLLECCMLMDQPCAESCAFSVSLADRFSMSILNKSSSNVNHG